VALAIAELLWRESAYIATDDMVMKLLSVCAAWREGSEYDDSGY
jgi:hypothetical protein